MGSPGNSRCRGSCLCRVHGFRSPARRPPYSPPNKKLSSRNAPLIIALSLCLFFSWLSAKIGMAAIVGAFFSGMMFADYAPRWDLLPGVGKITEFLAPYFFFSIGSRLDPRLFTGEILLAAIVTSLLAIVSKVVGCGLPVLDDGWRNALQI